MGPKFIFCRRKSRYIAICTSPIISLVCPPPPPPKKNTIYIAFAFHSSWVLQSPPETLMAKFCGGGGGRGQRRTRSINMGLYGRCTNWVHRGQISGDLSHPYRGYSGLQVTVMFEGLFCVLNFRFRDFCWVGKFWQVYFWVALSRDFLGYSICFLEIFMARKFNSMSLTKE